MWLVLLGGVCKCRSPGLAPGLLIPKVFMGLRKSFLAPSPSDSFTVHLWSDICTNVNLVQVS